MKSVIVCGLLVLAGQALTVNPELYNQQSMRVTTSSVVVLVGIAATISLCDAFSSPSSMMIPSRHHHHQFLHRLLMADGGSSSSNNNNDDDVGVLNRYSR
jgi:hypothetical protein